MLVCLFAHLCVTCDALSQTWHYLRCAEWDSRRLAVFVPVGLFMDSFCFPFCSPYNMQLHVLLSNTGFGLFALIFTAAAGIIVGHPFNPCNVRFLPDFGGNISEEECISWLSAPESGDKQRLAKNFIAWMTAAVRIEGSLFLSLAIGAAYQLTQPVSSRRGVAFVYGVMAIVLGLVDSHEAGFIPYGNNPFMTEDVAAKQIPVIGLHFLFASLFWGSFLLTPKTTAASSQKAE